MPIHSQRSLTYTAAGHTRRTIEFQGNDSRIL